MNDNSNEVAKAASLGEALRLVQLFPTGTPPLDGEWHRAADPLHPKPENQAAYFRGCQLSSGIVDVLFGSWWRQAQGLGGPWSWTSQIVSLLSPEHAAQLEQERAALKVHYNAIRTQRQAEAAVTAKRLWDTARSILDDQHPYLHRKGVPGYGVVRVTPETQMLLVPLVDVQTDALCSLLRILPDGAKYNLEGGQKKGCACRIGSEPAPGHRVWLCEGIATGLSLYQAHQEIVFVCGDAGNLAPVAMALRARYPHVALWVAGDQDAAGQQGVQKAQTAIQGLSAVFPIFPPGVTGTDWNDLHMGAGLSVVQTQLEAALRPTTESLRPPLPQPQAFPRKALGPLLGPAADALAESVQSPLPIIAASLMAGAALTVQPFVNVLIDGRIIPTSLFIITVADSGERKTATDRTVLAEHHALQKDWVAAYRVALETYEEEVKRGKSS